MKPESILNADLLDILFENRNKDYGAYDLRRAYQKRLLKAVMGMLLLVLMLFCWSFWSRNSNSQQTARIFNIPPDQILTPVDLEKEKPKIPEQRKPVETIQNTTVVVVPNQEADKPLPTVEELSKDVAFGTEDIKGDPASTATEPPAEKTGTADAPPTTEPAKEDGPVTHAEFMPEYPGGEKALQRFLYKNFRFEFDNMQPGSRVEIRCRFVVDKEGNVTGIEIIKSGSEAFDKEVTRVIAKMAKWKPGSQNGRNVAVYFTIPIIVQVPEE